MSYGFSAQNQSGYVQIDQDYSNYTVVTTGTLSVAGSEAGSAVSFTDRGSAPLVFAKTASNVYVALKDVTNTSATFQTYDTAGNYAAATISYMLCWPASTGSAPTGHGLCIYTPSGSVAFDSSRNYPRVVNVLTAGALTPASPEASIGFSPARSNPWICLSALYGIRAADTDYTQFSWFLHAGVRPESTTSLRVKLLIHHSLPQWPIAGSSNTKITTAILTNP